MKLTKKNLDIYCQVFEWVQYQLKGTNKIIPHVKNYVIDTLKNTKEI